jgi:hypothetical protein
VAYKLVHGGWSGAHGFRHLRRRLAASGHEVFTPSVTGAVEHLAARIRHLVYLDAFVPADGETALEYVLGVAPGPIELMEEWLVPPPEREYDDPVEAEWMTARGNPHPLGCFTEPIRVRRPLEDHPFARTYIKATLDSDTDLGADALCSAARRAKLSDAWNYRETETTHMVPSNRPDGLAAILAELA